MPVVKRQLSSAPLKALTLAIKQAIQVDPTLRGIKVFGGHGVPGYHNALVFYPLLFLFLVHSPSLLPPSLI